MTDGFKKILPAVLGLIILYAIVSLPILHAGFFSDDTYNNTTRGLMALASQNLWEFCHSINAGYFLRDGRIFPIAVYLRHIFCYFFVTQSSYQGVRVLFIWLSALIVAWLVQTITKNIKISLTFLVLLPIFWTIRDFHDPLTSFDVMFSGLLIFNTLTLIGFLRARETRRFFWHFFSYAAYLAALLIYEVSLASFTAIILLSWLEKTSLKDFFKRVFVYVLITVVFLFCCIYVRHHASALYNGITVGSPLYFFPTFVKQFIAGVPLTYWLLAIRPIFSKDFFQLTFLPNLPWLLAAFFLFYCLLRSVISRLSFTAVQERFLLIIGFSFVFLPCFLIGLSQKYQHMPWGMGYLPVYLQYPGMCFLFMVWLSHSKLKIKKGFLAFLGFVLSFTISLNLYTVRQENNIWFLGRELVQKALSQGFLNHLPKHTLLVGKISGWNTSAFYKQYGDIEVDALSITTPDQLIPNRHFDPKTPNIIEYVQDKKFFLDAQPVDNTCSGYVILGEIRKPKFTRLDHQLVLKSFIVKNPRVFLSVDNDKNKKLVLMLLKSGFITMPKGAWQSLVAEVSGHDTLMLPKGDYEISATNRWHYVQEALEKNQVKNASL